MRGNDQAQDTIELFSSLCVVLFGVATVALWLGDRPGGPLRWRLASGSALAAAGLGLLVSQVIGHLWDRARPFAAHPAETVLLAAPSRDLSFPSDHATAAFAIAFAVFFVSRRAGACFLAAAGLIALTRIFLGLHYPGDVAAGALIGVVSAWAVVVPGKRPMSALLLLVSRATDPGVRTMWELASRTARKRRFR
jgi:undecaprenyl-diphosphatase